MTFLNFGVNVDTFEFRAKELSVAETEDGPLSIDEIATIRECAEMYTRLVTRFPGHETDTEWFLGAMDEKDKKFIIKPESVGEVREHKVEHFLYLCKGSMSLLHESKDSRYAAAWKKPSLAFVRHEDHRKSEIVFPATNGVGAAVRFRDRGVIIGVSGASQEACTAVAVNIAFSIGLPVGDVEHIMGHTKFSMIYDLHALASKEQLG